MADGSAIAPENGLLAQLKALTLADQVVINAVAFAVTEIHAQNDKNRALAIQIAAGRAAQATVHLPIMGRFAEAAGHLAAAWRDPGERSATWAAAQGAAQAVVAEFMWMRLAAAEDAVQAKEHEGRGQ